MSLTNYKEQLPLSWKCSVVRKPKVTATLLTVTKKLILETFITSLLKNIHIINRYMVFFAKIATHKITIYVISCYLGLSFMYPICLFSIYGSRSIMYRNILPHENVIITEDLHLSWIKSKIISHVQNYCSLRITRHFRMCYCMKSSLQTTTLFVIKTYFIPYLIYWYLFSVYYTVHR